MKRSTQSIYKLNYHEAVRLDFDDAVNYYATRSERAAVGFQLDFEDSIGLIASAPFSGLGYAVHDEIRSLKLSGYPYRIYYRVREKQVLLLLIFNTYQSPEKLEKLLKKRS